jgi:hypothetical protein
METFKQWLLNEYDPLTIVDIAEAGCDQGFSGMIYYKETSALYERFKHDIWDILEEEAKEYGYACALEMLSHWYNSPLSIASLEQYLVWAAAEITARELVDNKQLDDTEYNLDDYKARLS